MDYIVDGKATVDLYQSSVDTKSKRTSSYTNVANNLPFVLAQVLDEKQKVRFNNKDYYVVRSSWNQGLYAPNGFQVRRTDRQLPDEIYWMWKLIGAADEEMQKLQRDKRYTNDPQTIAEIDKKIRRLQAKSELSVPSRDSHSIPSWKNTLLQRLQGGTAAYDVEADAGQTQKKSKQPKNPVERVILEVETKLMELEVDYRAEKFAQLDEEARDDTFYASLVEEQITDMQVFERIQSEYDSFLRKAIERYKQTYAKFVYLHMAIHFMAVEAIVANALTCTSQRTCNEELQHYVTVRFKQPFTARLNVPEMQTRVEAINRRMVKYYEDFKGKCQPDCSSQALELLRSAVITERDSLFSILSEKDEEDEAQVKDEDEAAEQAPPQAEFKYIDAVKKEVLKTLKICEQLMEQMFAEASLFGSMPPKRQFARFHPMLDAIGAFLKLNPLERLEDVVKPPCSKKTQGFRTSLQKIDALFSIFKNAMFHRVVTPFGSASIRPSFVAESLLSAEQYVLFKYVKEMVFDYGRHVETALHGLVGEPNKQKSAAYKKILLMTEWFTRRYGIQEANEDEMKDERTKQDLRFILEETVQVVNIAENMKMRKSAASVRQDGNPRTLLNGSSTVEVIMLTYMYPEKNVVRRIVAQVQQALSFNEFHAVQFVAEAVVNYKKYGDKAKMKLFNQYVLQCGSTSRVLPQLLFVQGELEKIKKAAAAIPDYYEAEYPPRSKDDWTAWAKSKAAAIRRPGNIFLQGGDTIVCTKTVHLTSNPKFFEYTKTAKCNDNWKEFMDRFRVSYLESDPTQLKPKEKEKEKENKPGMLSSDSRFDPSMFFERSRF